MAAQLIKHFDEKWDEYYLYVSITIMTIVLILLMVAWLTGVLQ